MGGPTPGDFRRPCRTGKSPSGSSLALTCSISILDMQALISSAERSASRPSSCASWGPAQRLGASSAPAMLRFKRAAGRSSASRGAGASSRPVAKSPRGLPCFARLLVSQVDSSQHETEEESDRSEALRRSMARVARGGGRGAELDGVRETDRKGGGSAAGRSGAAAAGA